MAIESCQASRYEMNRSDRVNRRRGLRGLSVAIAVVGWTATWDSATRADEPKVFRAGAHAADITPLRFPISMNGQMQDQVARAAHDRLHARCLVLDDGKAPVAIVVVDSCMVPRPVFDEAKAKA